MIFFGRQIGGAELQFMELAESLAKNHKVTLVSLGGRGAVESRPISDKIDIRCFPYRTKLQSIAALVHAYFFCRSTPAVRLISTSFIGNTLAYVSRLLSKRRLVSLQTVSACANYPVLDRIILRRFDVLIAGAEDIKEYLLRHGQVAERIATIHNWVDVASRLPTDDQNCIRREYAVDGKFIIGCIGRLHPQKGQVFLLRAFARLIQDGLENIVLLIVGDGPMRTSLVNQTAKLGIDSHVRFLGTVTGNAYNNILSIMDLYVQPSLYEGLPRTLLDAMAAERAIIATNVNGNREAIEDEVNGILVIPESSEQLHRAIRRLMDDPTFCEQIAARARECVITNFGMARQLAKIENIVLSD